MAKGTKKRKKLKKYIKQLERRIKSTAELAWYSALTNIDEGGRKIYEDFDEFWKHEGNNNNEQRTTKV